MIFLVVLGMLLALSWRLGLGIAFRAEIAVKTRFFPA